MQPVYLDCNGSTPLDPEVLTVLAAQFTGAPGNSASRTHVFGTRAKEVVEVARRQVASSVGAQPQDVIFTSGATESNNLAIVGFARRLRRVGHIVTTEIEHKAVLEPVQFLEEQGFSVTRLKVGASGAISSHAVLESIRQDTVLVSVMHVNNETGISQPISQIADQLGDHPACLHIDAAQGYAWDQVSLSHPRIDLISISGHKVYAPQGVGALVVRSRDYTRPKLEPLILGGGQERGARGGTLPVPLIAALGKAAELAVLKLGERRSTCQAFRQTALAALDQVKPIYSGDQSLVLDHVLHFRVPNVDSEALILATKDLIAISNGAACTSAAYAPSHVLLAMGFTKEEATSCLRLSWSHLTDAVDWDEVIRRIKSLA